MRTVRRTVRVEGFEQPEDVRDFFKRCYGPTIVAYRNIADDEARTAELDTAFADMVRRFDTGTPGNVVLDWEYLLFTATKR